MIRYGDEIHLVRDEVSRLAHLERDEAAMAP